MYLCVYLHVAVCVLCACLDWCEMTVEKPCVSGCNGTFFSLIYKYFKKYIMHNKDAS